MIIFKEKKYSASYMINMIISKLISKLDKDRIDSYDTSSKIPTDSISITCDLDEVEIYIPEDNEYSQYGIDNAIRKSAPSIRTSIEDLGDNMFKMKCRGKFTFEQYYKIVKYIIENEGYCVIIDKNI